VVFQLGDHEEVRRYKLRAVGRVAERLELPDSHPVLHNGGSSKPIFMGSPELD
jgi:hypothetical protein